MEEKIRTSKCDLNRSRTDCCDKLSDVFGTRGGSTWNGIYYFNHTCMFYQYLHCLVYGRAKRSHA